MHERESRGARVEATHRDAVDLCGPDGGDTIKGAGSHSSRPHGPVTLVWP